MTQRLIGTHRTLRNIVDDPSWTRAAFARWSDTNDNGVNLSDVVNETLAAFDAGDQDVAAARPVIEKILQRPGKNALRDLGVVTVTMADIEPGMHGRIGWLFTSGATLFALVLHSAFEDDIPGEYLDDGKNAYTELQLKLIRSRRGGAAYYASATRLGRSRRNRTDVTTAMQRYGWACYIAGRREEITNDLLEGVNGGQVEQASRQFFESSGKGELDDLKNQLYPRSEAGLPFTHRFRHSTVQDGDRTYEQVHRKEVEQAPGGEKILQVLVPMVASGASWVSIGRKAQEYDIEARAAKDIANDTGRTLADLKLPEVAVRNMFRKFLTLWMTGTHPLIWHGKVQGGAVYGQHGSPTPYTLEQLRTMTPRQRTKAEKGYFTVALEWGRPLMPDDTGDECPYGVPWKTWELAKARVDEETGAPRRRGAAAQLRDKKPLPGRHEWEANGMRQIISGNRSTFYTLYERPLSISGGWAVAPRQYLARWRAADEHAALGEALTDLAADLGDQVATLDLHINTRNPLLQDSAKARRDRETSQVTADIDRLTRQIEAVPGLANMLFADGNTDAAKLQYELLPGLREALADAKRHLSELKARQQEAHDSTADAQFGSLVAVAAGLRAYPDAAPYQLADACEALIHDRQAEVTNGGLSVNITCMIYLELDDGGVGTHEVSYVVANRKRGANKLDGDICERTARTWFTAKTPVTIDDLAEELGWTTHETQRKIRVWLGDRTHVPADSALRDQPVRVPVGNLRPAILDCPLVEVRHALWAALMPSESHVAAYLSDEYRAHIVRTYLIPDAHWNTRWAADTHVQRRRLLKLCMESDDITAGIGVHDAARALGLAPQTIYDFSRAAPTNFRSTTPVYPATAERIERPVPPHAQSKPGNEARVRPVRCPHRDCVANSRGGRGGWCTVVLRVPELAHTALLCPDCMRSPDPAMADIRFPAAYLIEWVGPVGFGAGRRPGRDSSARTVADPDAARTI